MFRPCPCVKKQTCVHLSEERLKKQHVALFVVADMTGLNFGHSTPVSQVLMSPPPLPTLTSGVRISCIFSGGRLCSSVCGVTVEGAEGLPASYCTLEASAVEITTCVWRSKLIAPVPYRYLMGVCWQTNERATAARELAPAAKLVLTDGQTVSRL